MDENFSIIDSGPIYKETVLGRWPVEPWNTATTLLFAVLVVYWLRKIRGDRFRYQILVFTLPIVGVGAVGGFLYHSLRNHIAWLLLDWVPIVVVANIFALYFWKNVLKRWSYTIFATYFPLICSLPLQQAKRYDMMLAMSLSYSALALSVLMPIFFFARQNQYRHIRWAVASLVTIVTAILLRTFDQHPVFSWLPMGTHFLWHTLGALTCHLLVIYVYKTIEDSKDVSFPLKEAGSSR